MNIDQIINLGDESKKLMTVEHEPNPKEAAEQLGVNTKTVKAVFAEDGYYGASVEVSEDQTEIQEPILLDDAPTVKISPNMFPEPIGNMVDAVSRATETPVELPAVFVLAVLATCTQQKFQVSPDPDYSEPLNLWTMAALESGNRKSAVTKILTGPLFDFELEQVEKNVPEIKRLQEERENKIARIKILRGQYAKAEIVDLPVIEKEILETNESMPEIPIEQRLWVQDITSEKLGDVMAEQGEKIAILSSEGGIFDTIGGRYSNNIPNLDIYLQAHAGDPVRVDRNSRGSIFMRNPSLSMGLSPQPEVLHGLSDKPGFRGRGLCARFLYVLPASPLGNRKLKTHPIPEAVKAEYKSILVSLLSISPNKDTNGIIQPLVLTLTGEAKKEWKDFALVVEGKMKPGGEYENMTDWASKLPGAALRIAGNFHCVIHAYNQPAMSPISLETMRDALELSSILAKHASLVFGFMGADKSITAAKKVWAWAQRNQKKEFSARDCFQALKGTYRRMDELNPAFNILLERFYLFEKPKEDKPGRPSKTFTVHEKLTEDWI